MLFSSSSTTRAVRRRRDEKERLEISFVVLERAGEEEGDKGGKEEGSHVFRGGDDEVRGSRAATRVGDILSDVEKSRGQAETRA